MSLLYVYRINFLEDFQNHGEMQIPETIEVNVVEGI